MRWLPLLISLAAAYINDVTRDHREHTLHEWNDLPTRNAWGVSDERMMVNFMIVDVDLSSDMQLYLYNDVLARVRRYLHDRLTVRSWTTASTGTNAEYHLKLPDECAGFQIPDRMKYYRTAGNTVNIFVYGHEAEPLVGSWGAPCVVDTTTSSGTGEPVYGAIWINTQLLSMSTDADNFHNMLKQTFHVLAFHNHLYERWVDSRNGYAAYTDPIIESTSNGKTTYKLATTGFLTHLRATTGCATVDGLELEETADDKIAGVNFDKKLAGNEIMTNGFDSEPTVVSGLTWNALEDSGWYQVSFNERESGGLVTNEDPAANELAWLKDAGCTFFTDACVTGGSPNFDQFCTDSAYEPTCNHDMTHKGSCAYSPGLYPGLSPYGGHDPRADSCPYVVSVEGGDCRDTNLGVFARMGYGEKYGPKSRCITGRLAPEGYLATCDFSGCFEVTCDVANTKVTISIGGEDVECLFTEKGDEKEVTGMTGKFICPDGALMCNAEINNCVGSCFGQGTCLGPEGCQCHPGFYGDDCRKKCDLSCEHCDGPKASDCTSCRSGFTLASGACGCDTGSYNDYFGTCDTTCNSYTLSNADSVCSNVALLPGIGFLASDTPSSRSSSDYTFGFQNTGTSTYLYTNPSDPVIINPMGAFFYNDCSVIGISTAVQTYGDWTFEAWIRPMHFQRVLLSTRFTNDMSHYNRQDLFELFLTKCQGLAVNWHWDQFATPGALITANQWSHVAVIVKKVGYASAIELWVNGVHRGGGISFREWDHTIDYGGSGTLNWMWQVGKDQFNEETYRGWIYSFRLWTHALNAEDLNFNTECDKNLSNCTYCPCRDAMECLSDCDVGYWSNGSYHNSARSVGVCEECHSTCDDKTTRGCSVGNASTNCHTCGGDCIQNDGNCCTTTSTCGYSSSPSLSNCAQSNYAGFSDTCTNCNSGYEIDTRVYGDQSGFSYIDTCTDCGDTNPENCTYGQYYHLTVEACKCKNGQYYNTDKKKCNDCPAGCKTCTSSNVYDCGECEEGYLQSHKAGACVKECPTGSIKREGRCDDPHDDQTNCPSDSAFGTPASYKIEHIFDKLDIDYINPEANIGEENYIIGGYQAGGAEVDDPIVMKGRGLWFDGLHAHLTFGRTHLDHTYSMNFMVKNYLMHGQEAAIYSTYREPDVKYVDNTSLFTYSLNFDDIVFRDAVGDLYYKTSCSIATFKQWTVITIAAEWIQYMEQTKLTFKRNDEEVDSTHVPKILLDSRDYLHFFGGVRHNNQVVQPYRGFLYAVGLINFQPDARPTWYDTQTCMWNQVCIWDGSAAHYPSNCEPFTFEYQDSTCYMCHIGCNRGCVRLENCDLCDDSCNGLCTGFTANDCIV